MLNAFRKAQIWSKMPIKLQNHTILCEKSRTYFLFWSSWRGAGLLKSLDFGLIINNYNHAPRPHRENTVYLEILETHLMLMN
ncbi:hypothetical protein O9G_001674 [Rozella allomycis CSF55]|uniref:Uncharacterized protein n=1 Tax=Rozella allomycis (strain CSF55) TaxID=988480 RepID=A0A075AXR6_ROZAC|nr:hypothetical protein O9G_001674 [Rozella allomycis CSF55]|eukprot:EPZ34944.1 hypothetical protein O9G_001674 [Rozella allomycis CSF55]